MFSRFFSGALIKSILSFVKASFPPSPLIPEVGLAKLEHFQCLKRSLLWWQVLVLGIFCVHASLSCSTFLFQDITEPAFLIAFPLSAFSLNIKITLAKLGFLRLPLCRVEARRGV